MCMGIGKARFYSFKISGPVPGHLREREGRVERSKEKSVIKRDRRSEKGFGLK